MSSPCAWTRCRRWSATTGMSRIATSRATGSGTSSRSETASARSRPATGTLVNQISSMHCRMTRVGKRVHAMRARAVAPVTGSSSHAVGTSRSRGRAGIGGRPQPDASTCKNRRGIRPDGRSQPSATPAGVLALRLLMALDGGSSGRVGQGKLSRACPRILRGFPGGRRIPESFRSWRNLSVGLPAGGAGSSGHRRLGRARACDCPGAGASRVRRGSGWPLGCAMRGGSRAAGCRDRAPGAGPRVRRHR